MSSSKKIIAVIPARLASSRLKQKLLLKLEDKTILQRTFEQVSSSKHVSEVHIATDSERIFEHAKTFTDNVAMTSEDHQSGTDRIAELAEKNHDWDIVINVQGDEPFINPEDIDKVAEVFLHDPLMEMASLYHEISMDDRSEFENPNNVKVVTDANDCALYFSRAPIPFVRDSLKDQKPQAKKHIGLYAYKRDTLLALTQLPNSKLEQLEKLEQLRALENGIKIKMLKSSSASLGIDTEEDFQQAKVLLG